MSTPSQNLKNYLYNLDKLQNLDKQAKSGDAKALLEMATLFETGLYYKKPEPKSLSLQLHEAQQAAEAEIAWSLDGEPEDIGPDAHRYTGIFDVGPTPPRQPDYKDSKLAEELRKLAGDNEKVRLEQYNSLQILDEQGNFVYADRKKTKAVIVASIQAQYAPFMTPAFKQQCDANRQASVTATAYLSGNSPETENTEKSDKKAKA